MMPAPRWFAAAIATLLASAPAAWAVDPASSSTPPGPALEGNANSLLSQSDRDFLFKDAQGAAFERELAEIAIDKSVDPRVKQLARTIVDDHLSYNSTLIQVGEDSGVTLPTAPDTQHIHRIDQLATLSGKDFDAAFVKEMVDANKEDIDDAAHEDGTTWSALIHDFIVRFKPMDEKHLHDAQALQTS